MNLAGSMFKQGPFETPQPGTAMPFLPVPHTCKCSKPSFPWCKTSRTLMTESRQTAPGLRSLQPHVLSQPQPKPHAECSGMSVTHNTPPAAAALAGTARGFVFNRSLLCPGWAFIRYDRHWLQGWDQVWSEQILRRLCLRLVCRSSFPLYIPPRSSSFCIHTMFPV